MADIRLQRGHVQQRHAAHRFQKLLVQTTRLANVNTFLSVLVVVTVCAFMYTSFETGVFFSAFSRDDNLDYGIVIDAGSHGSRIHVYSWASRVQDNRRPLSGPVTFPKELFSVSLSPGISSMADTDPSATGDVCIAPLVQAAQRGLQQHGISQDKWGTFPVYLKATAGMRNMDALSRSRIMNSIRRYLSNKTLTPFAFHWDWARVIAGEEEGVYGWLAVNSALGTALELPDKTVGALDMGGASMQITFFPKHTSVIEDYYGLMLGGKTVRLYSHSYLGYGWGDALTRITTKLSLQRILELSRTNKGDGLRLNTELNKLREAISAPLQQSNGIYQEATSAPSILVPPGSPNSLAATALINLTGTHPCYPAGYKFSFDLPSLVYPDGRFYVDVDAVTLSKYMALIGIPVQFHQGVLSRRKQGVGSPSSAALSSLKQSKSGVSNAENLYYKGAHNMNKEKNSSLFKIAQNHSESSKTLTNDQYTLNNVSKSSLAASVVEPIQEFSTSVYDAEELEQALPTPGLQPQGFSPLDAPLPLNIAPKVRFVIQFTGTSDTKTCRQLARSLFYEGPCFVHSCSFNGVYQPRLEDSRFIAFGQFAKVQRALNLSANATPGDVTAAADQVCAKSRLELRHEWKDPRHTYRVYGKNGVMKLCWKALWAETVLSWGYGFPVHSRAITYTQQRELQNETDTTIPLGWATGSMIYEVNKLPWIVSTSQFLLSSLLAIGSTLLLTVFIAILLIEINGYQKLLNIMGVTPCRVALLSQQFVPIPYDDAITSGYTQLP